MCSFCACGYSVQVLLKFMHAHTWQKGHAWVGMDVELLCTSEILFAAKGNIK